jgi:hypothetical protein
MTNRLQACRDAPLNAESRVPKRRPLSGGAAIRAVCAAVCCCAVLAACGDRAAPVATTAPAELSSQFNVSASAPSVTALPAIVIQSPAHPLGMPDQADASAVAAPPLAPPVIHSAD